MEIQAILMLFFVIKNKENECILDPINVELDID